MDVALVGRDLPRLVVPELNDPPNGDLELQPYAPSRPCSPSCTDTSSRGSRAARALRRAEGTPQESVLTVSEILAAVNAVADDVFRHWSWETSGRPLLFGVDESN